ncbi:MAG: membrane protein insertase YidC [candidate division KSB1 bacterium]|nr:membrane protein insertase YidC [candidate division KSB1 bacterium]
MDLDRRTVLAFLLIGLVLILMQTDLYRRWLYRGTPRSAGAGQAGVAMRTGEEPVVEGGFQVLGGEQMAAGEEEVGTARMEPPAEGRERRIVVRTSLYQGEISTRGARLVSWRMKNYRGPDGQAVELIGDGEASNLGLRFVVGLDTVDSKGWVWEFEGPDTLTVSDGEEARLEFRLVWGDGRAASKMLTLYGGRYDILMQVRLEGWDTIVADKSYRIAWGGGIPSSEARVAEDASYTKVYGLLGKSLEKVDVGKSGAVSQAVSGVVRWVAGRTKYFTVALIPQGLEGEGIEVKGWRGKVRGGDWKFYDFALRLPLVRPREEHTIRVYLGPLDYSIVRRYGADLERMMDFGWSVIRPISKGILILFRWFHRLVPNYGVVLIIFSLLVKIVVYPLTRKSYVSMKQMQLLQPRLAELKEKYGNDPQRLNRETMKLYREYGINPMSGCLPLLLQFPLLYALFIVFRSTIELRGAKFVGWMKDLSQPDTVLELPFSLPLYGRGVCVLPIVMGITMFVQQKMTVTDPKQKAMVYVMPIFFVLLFNTFPSGLNLYYTLFNVLSIVQQKVIPEKAVQLEPREAAPKRRGWRKV